MIYPQKAKASIHMARTDKNRSVVLKEQREKLISAFLEGKSPDFLTRQAEILDDYFRNRFEESRIGPKMNITKNPYALIAVGGYGRAEQCVFSDVDLLFLFRKQVPREAEKLIQEMIYPLWDIGLEVGYATRSIKECLSLAKEDYEVLTSLLDARFICGISKPHLQLMEEVRKKILNRKKNAVIRWLVETNTERHRQLGDSSYLLEPNLKQGLGGLRDYHTMLWIANIKSNIKGKRDLEYFGYLSHDEYQMLEEALGFVWNVRNRLHLLTGRKCDQLHFQHQIRLAEELQYQSDNGQQPVEVFLGQLHGQMEFIKEQHLMFLYEQGYSTRRRWRKPRPIETRIKGLTVVRDRLAFSSPKVVIKHPALLMQIFVESARLKVPLGAEAKRLVKEFGYLADEKFIVFREVVKGFEKVLRTSAPTFNVLNEMLRSGFLMRFIPEFRHIVDRIQYDEYHLYPVDRHSLRAVRLLKTFGTREDESDDPLCGKLYRDLSNRAPLLWATLLHDIGKGYQGRDHAKRGAEVARKILLDKGYRQKDAETVAFLIEHHLLLVITATRRDVNDEETAIKCAREIKDAKWLKMLYLLTVADCMATGPKAWTSWTASLLRDLFLKVLNILEKGDLASREAVAAVEAKKEYLLKDIRDTDEKKWLISLYEMMSPRYLMYTPAEIMQNHIGLYRHLKDNEFVWKIDLEKESDIREVTICAKDRSGLISKISGAFTLNNIDILDTQVFTWKNDIALDIFKVKAPLDTIFESERWEKTARDLTDALSGKLNLAIALKGKLKAIKSSKPRALGRPNRVVVDNESSSFFTIVEVFTYDFPGVLFSVTDALLRCRLDVRVAKIATYVDQVVDVFYVRDFYGEKVDLPEQVKAIQSTVEGVLPGRR